jgi:hypothetical protein
MIGGGHRSITVAGHLRFAPGELWQPNDDESAVSFGEDLMSRISYS